MNVFSGTNKKKRAPSVKVRLTTNYGLFVTKYIKHVNISTYVVLPLTSSCTRKYTLSPQRDSKKTETGCDLIQSTVEKHESFKIQM